MADYYEPTVVQQIIPHADMTPLERLLLSRIFESERIDDGWYFFAQQSPCDMIYATRAELEEALASSLESGAHRGVTERLAAVDTDDIEIDPNLCDTSWEQILQDIVKRSQTLRYITVISAFTCTKMRPDGFGGMVRLITPEAILGKSTNDIVEDFLSETGLDAPPEAKTGDAPPAASPSE